MTVGQLIDQLTKLDENMRVVVDGYESGYDDPKVTRCLVMVDGNWDQRTEEKDFVYGGRHTSGHRGDDRMTVVLIGR